MRGHLKKIHLDYTNALVQHESKMTQRRISKLNLLDGVYEDDEAAYVIAAERILYEPFRLRNLWKYITSGTMRVPI